MRILTITHPNVENGLGCRVTMWVAGCSHHCEGCHNKHTWSYDQGSELKDEKVREKIFETVSHDYIQGLTVSGGDPLDQSVDSLHELDHFLVEFKMKFPDKNIWIYSGSVYEDCIKDEVKKSILDKCNVMVDGPFIKDKFDRNIAFRGSLNQRIIDLKESKKQGKAIVIDLD